MDQIAINNTETNPMVTNYMGMQNFLNSPLVQLRMLVTSWFLGEPTYYIPSNDKQKNNQQLKKINNSEILLDLYLFQNFRNETTTNIFNSVTHDALNQDFEAVLELAVVARTEYNMRSGPCALLLLSACHSKRKEYNARNPTKFRGYAKKIIKIPTDAYMIFDLYKKMNQDEKG